MKIGIVKEISPGERRVAGSPATVARLVKEGFEVIVESSAGAGASFGDQAYRDAGAEIAMSARQVFTEADVVGKVRAPMKHPTIGYHEADLLKSGSTLISFLFPAQNAELIEKLKVRKVNVIAVDCIPRISRAQRVDALSSMANIAGYRAVIEAAQHFGSFFTGQFTAAGKVPPAKVLIIGAGVAGLAAIAAARGLGAIVRAFDTREAAAEQVESLGGEFLLLDFAESGEGGGGYAKVMSKEFIDAEMAMFREQAREIDIVITTALIPGKKAPTLWTKDMVESMKPGSVVVDMAAEQGGNCEYTQPGQVVVEHGVTIVGHTDLPSRMANVSSDLYGTNLTHLLDEMGGAEGFTIDEENDIVRGALVVHNGEIKWPPPPPKKVEPEVKESREGTEPSIDLKDVAEPVVPAPKKAVAAGAIWAVVGIAFAAAWLGLRFGMADTTMGGETVDLLQRLTVFVLACFVGWQVVWNVTPALHTPLMSVTNAISGIIIIGGVLQLGGGDVNAALIIGAVATLFASINVVGGFFVTQRMLQMFRR